MNKRVFLIVLDSVGIGEMPDADLYGDKGANTLKSISKSPYFKISTLKKLGYFNIEGVDYLKPYSDPLGVYGRIEELSKGKDTTTGHWEIAGIVSEKPFPVYPDGFPDEILDKFKKATGRGVLCNKPYSGTQVINDYGNDHLRTGDLIVYTSADSVFQIAAHEDIVSIEELYTYCKAARKILKGKHAVGRVIARPFTGSDGNFRRTSNRRDFSLIPPGNTMLDYIRNSGYDTIAIGKITDIFSKKGITRSVFTHNNEEGMKALEDVVKEDFSGLCFVNLVDFDMLYGHRNDVDGYARALSCFDIWLESFIQNLKDDDLLIITADHGCDPGMKSSTDHTREYVPLLCYMKGIKGNDLLTMKGFSVIGKTICEYLDIKNDIECISFLKTLKNN